MNDATKIIIKRFWDNIFIPFIIYTAIAIAFFIVGLLVGADKPNRELGIADTRIGELGKIIDESRHRIAELEGTVKDLTAINNRIQESYNRTIAVITEVDNTISRLQENQGSMAEKLRRIITALREIQTGLRNILNS